MMIKCPECNHENQLGSIFCRNCGGKLDIERLEPKVKDKAGPNIFKIVRSIILVILILVLIGLFVGIFVPVGYPEYKPLAADQQEQVDATMSEMVKRVEQNSGRKLNYVFSPQAATYAYGKNFLEAVNSDAGTSYHIEEIIFTVDANRNIVMVLKTKLAGKVPVRFTISGMPVGNFEEEGSLGFQVKGAKVGHIPVPGGLSKIVLDKFKILTDGERINKYFQAIESIDIDENNNFSITLKKPSRRSRKRNK